MSVSRLPQVKDSLRRRSDNSEVRGNEVNGSRASSNILAYNSDSHHDRKINNALKTIQESYKEKVHEMEGVIQRMKIYSVNQERKIAELENSVEKLQLNINLKDKKYQDLEFKHNDVLRDQKQLVEKYNQLRRYTAELDRFKKKLINLSGTGPIPINEEFIEQSLAIEEEKIIPKRNLFSPTSSKHQYNSTNKYNHKINNKFDIDMISNSNSATRVAKNPTSPSLNMDESEFNPDPSSIFFKKTYTNTNDLETEGGEDTKDIEFSTTMEEVYGEIVATLDTPEFNIFKDVIEKFNRHEISPKNCLDTLKSIILNQDHFDRMRMQVLRVASNRIPNLDIQLDDLASE
ncbi:hypothetical protein K502DRAFT_367664 [Neoconidiobolus thromboides FSU 785]|nr:hypothetical protein K502DRAFT_367664 [Neoconidiobolus thromboides FSU 785]